MNIMDLEQAIDDNVVCYDWEAPRGHVTQNLVGYMNGYLEEFVFDNTHVQALYVPLGCTILLYEPIKIFYQEIDITHFYNDMNCSMPSEDRYIIGALKSDGKYLLGAC